MINEWIRIRMNKSIWMTDVDDHVVYRSFVGSSNDSGSESSNDESFDDMSGMMTSLPTTSAVMMILATPSPATTIPATKSTTTSARTTMTKTTTRAKIQASRSLRWWEGKTCHAECLLCWRAWFGIGIWLAFTNATAMMSANVSIFEAVISYFDFVCMLEALVRRLLSSRAIWSSGSTKFPLGSCWRRVRSTES